MKWIVIAIFLAGQQLAPAVPSSGFVIGWGVNVSGEATGKSSSYVFTNKGVVDEANYFATGTVTVAGQILTNVRAISSGMSHSLALRSDGTVAGFGDNMFGKAVGFTNENPSRASGEVKIDGQNIRNIVSIAAGKDFSLALEANGTVVTWGENYVPAELTNITGIAVEWNCSWALKRDGTIVGWAANPSSLKYGQLLPVENLSNIVRIAVGPGGNGTRGVALGSDGTVHTWGSETIYKDATPPVGLSNVIAIAVGYNHSLALKRDGTVVGWGFNNAGQATGIQTENSPNISAGTVTIGGHVLRNVVSIAASYGYSLALKNDGSIVTWGRMSNNLYPVKVPAGLSNVVAIAAGDGFCLAITTNNEVAQKFSDQ